jgi:hypothetical protein
MSKALAKKLKELGNKKGLVHHQDAVVVTEVNILTCA